MTTRTSRLQKELRQGKPFRNASQEAAVGLMRTADIVRRHFGKKLEPFGVTFSQYNVLRILRGAGADGLPTLGIAERMIEMTPGITRLLDRLEAKALIWRERCPSDRRQVTCRLTGKGSEVLAAVDVVIDEADDLSMAPLSETQLRTLIRLLDAIRSRHA
jgi:DNA-binding MarR family transcriptional regulator